ncbi:hypothetical protein C9374_009404 [Naegleria lovaniensis]|uniref:Uncharacterized protein n=1 Tax=Naegleria lovaniensis TaxID=51637 RepID=A0AA88GFD1_NAELO|nr:uncharacterized protein C9374_009404 [Naegleria lovaniensis]KAG2377493.1 hypothetical protein C9374_009404 [Naegleria lovaniensis]
MTNKSSSSRERMCVVCARTHPPTIFSCRYKVHTKNVDVLCSFFERELAQGELCDRCYRLWYKHRKQQEGGSEKANGSSSSAKRRRKASSAASAIKKRKKSTRNATKKNVNAVAIAAAEDEDSLEEEEEEDEVMDEDEVKDEEDEENEYDEEETAVSTFKQQRAVSEEEEDDDYESNDASSSSNEDGQVKLEKQSGSSSPIRLPLKKRAKSGAESSVHSTSSSTTPSLPHLELSGTTTNAAMEDNMYDYVSSASSSGGSSSNATSLQKRHYMKRGTSKELESSPRGHDDEEENDAAHDGFNSAATTLKKRNKPSPAKTEQDEDDDDTSNHNSNLTSYPYVLHSIISSNNANIGITLNNATLNNITNPFSESQMNTTKHARSQKSGETCAVNPSNSLVQRLEALSALSRDVRKSKRKRLLPMKSPARSKPEDALKLFKGNNPVYLQQAFSKSSFNSAAIVTTCNGYGSTSL